MGFAVVFVQDGPNSHSHFFPFFYELSDCDAPSSLFGLFLSLVEPCMSRTWIGECMNSRIFDTLRSSCGFPGDKIQ